MASERMSRYASASGKQWQIANVDPVVARHLVADLRIHAIDPAQVVDGLGFSLEHLAEPDFRLTFEQTCQIIRRSVRLLKSPQLGLRLGANVNLASWGIFYVGLMACSDTREWLDFAAEFLPPMVGLLDLRFADTPLGPGLLAKGLEDDPEVVTFLVENAFSALTYAFRTVVQGEQSPVLVEFSSPPPESRLLHEVSFGCEVLFDRPVNSIVFARATRTLRSADLVTVRRVRAAMALQNAEGNGRNELETCLVRAFDGRLAAPPVLADIAKSMYLSERTLRRRLADQGISYAEVLDRERRDCALSLIRSGHVSLRGIASTAGFADARSLRRAVRRWTGKSATNLRNNE